MLFIWPFVLFENAISDIAETLRLPSPPRFFQQEQLSTSRPRITQIIKSIQEDLPGLPKLPGPASTYLNTEEWRWKDYRGNDVVITVHRDAKRS